ncbi:zinc finger protein 233-like isoform X1 [Pieris brassicae]|uniref:zinc finger protein 233-like isoform X1 n=1 Tax=Pieris brassicae TaxID=7116 RepID=UPI001E660AB2|nr:zinc finger protein 233-like isoform X1 [Pieris brassicae]XP_045527089.1 zinc finger protein 233-like isoform X1 [Pieris brassicae]
MESKPVRMVNVVPITRLKKVPLPDDSEDTVACRICNKSFANEVALKNHCRIEHIDALLSGQDICVRKIKTVAISKDKRKKEMQDVDSEHIILSVEPIDIMNIALAQDHIINKNSDNDTNSSDGEKKAKRPKIEKVKVAVKKVKEVMAITGPFECLQPSSLVSDSICHQMFFSCCEYSTHIRDEHTRRRKGVKCQVCEKPLTASGNDQLPYICQFCAAGFERCMDLSDHVTKHHNKIKPYQCTVCNKRFTQQGGLAQHMRAHSGDKPFNCTYCPKAFTQKSGLDQHLRIHTKSKPYKCVICSKAFCQSVHLQQHMRTHTNVAPFQCIICQKRFKQSSHLNYHLKYHNPLNMTDEQKEKYTELMRMMGKESIFELLSAKGDSEENGSGANCEEVNCEDVELVVDGQELLENDIGNAVEVVYLDSI